MSFMSGNTDELRGYKTARRLYNQGATMLTGGASVKGAEWLQAHQFPIDVEKVRYEGSCVLIMDKTFECPTKEEVREAFLRLCEAYWPYKDWSKPCWKRET